MHQENQMPDGLRGPARSVYPLPANGTSASHPEIRADDFSALVHDARNMVSALSLFCDLLDEPGVLTAAFRHYGRELRLVGGASFRLLDKLAAYQGLREGDSTSADSFPGFPSDSNPSSLKVAGASEFLSAKRDHFQTPWNDSVDSLAGDVLANQNLISALVGPAVTVGFSHSGGRRSIPMRRDDLTRILVNLAKNAAEAMPGGGHLQIALEESMGRLSLSFTDNGPGIPPAYLESVFSPGFSTSIYLDGSVDSARAASGLSLANASPCSWPVRPRGLGLSIVRSLVAAAGGSVWAGNVGDGQTEGDQAASAPSRGAVITMEFPLEEAIDSIHGLAKRTETH